MSSQKKLHIYACISAVATFLLLIAGSLVTSTGSGLAVPDWPLSYGTLFPPMVGGIVYEHSHRVIAGLIGLMILALAISIAKTESRGWVKRLGFSALAAVCVQALLGGLTVLLLLPPQISIAHAMLGQFTFCLVVCIAWCTHPGWSDINEPLAIAKMRPLKRFSMIAAVCVFIQLLLGSIIRHTGHMVMVHIVGAFTVVAFTCICVGMTFSLRKYERVFFIWSHRLLLLVMVQIGFGFSVFFNRGAVGLRSVHVVLGALILAQAIIFVWDVRRRTE